MGRLHVKNYNEYLKRLKENFNGIRQQLSDEEVHSFISEYNLDSDWKINMADVRQDILFQILSPKSTIGKQKKISSYKEYLIKLKAVFDIPEVMPKDFEIKAEAGQLLKNGNQDVTFVSQDSDFKEYKDRKANNKLRNKVSVVKSVEEKLKKDKKKK